MLFLQLYECTLRSDVFLLFVEFFVLKWSVRPRVIVFNKVRLLKSWNVLSHSQSDIGFIHSSAFLFKAVVEDGGPRGGKDGRRRCGIFVQGLSSGVYHWELGDLSAKKC